MKIKKVTGKHYIYITEDEKLLLNASASNSVVVYDLTTQKQILKFKTLSNTSLYAVSPDKSLIAVLNTSGHIAIIALETGEEICRNKLEERESWQMIFTPDSKYVLVFDWSGRTILFNCKTNTHTILDGKKNVSIHDLPRVDFMHYDRFSNLIYKFIADTFGISSGVLQTTTANKDRIRYSFANIFPTKLPDHIRGGISFCSEHNYHVDKINRELIVTDKNFNEIKRIAWPDKVKEAISNREVFVSPYEKYVFFNLGAQIALRRKDPPALVSFEEYKQAKHLAYLYELETMSLIAEFDYEYICDFTMYDNDSKFVISTLKGTYFGEI